MQSSIFVAAVLCALVLAAEWLVARTFLRHFGTGLSVILLAAVASNTGLIPTSPRNAVVYQGILDFVAPLAIFLILLEVNLRNVLQAGSRMLVFFLTGSAGTVVGVMAAVWLVDAAATLGPSWAELAGMFTGTYTGGSVNFNAVALHYGVVQQGILFAGTVAVDNIITTLWMALCIALPKLLSGRSLRQSAGSEASFQHPGRGPQPVAVSGLALLLALALGSIWFSEWSGALFGKVGIAIPSILILTTLALTFAQVPRLANCPGAREIGLFSIYLFLAAIGAFCDLAALAQMGPVGITLLLFTATIVVVHAVVLFGVGWIWKRDWAMVAVASQANVGGPASAMALAGSLKREDLFLPSILVGSLGYAIGTYLGFLVVGLYKI